MSRLKHHHPSCLNCHYPLAEFDKFCPNCGQKPVSPKSSMHDLLHEFFHTFWHLDGKFFMTLHHLLIPGKLTVEFFKGHLKRYAHPIQLFLVIGAFAFGLLASTTKKAEEKAQASMEKKRDEYKRKAFLKELDSVRHTLIPPQYSDAEKRLLSDSLMFKMMHPDYNKTDREKIENEVQEALDKEFNKRYDVNPETKVSIKVGNEEYRNTYSVINEEDSIHEAREVFKDSMIDDLVALSDKSLAKKILEKVDTSIKVRETVAQSATDGFLQGMSDADKQEKERQELLNKVLPKADKEKLKLLDKLLPKIEDIKRKQPLKEAIRMYEDTNNFSFMGHAINIPSHEVYELSPEEIIEKYKVKGFGQKIAMRQGIKASQDAGNLIHFYMSKLFWATVTMIPALALFFSLVYWRRKHYYVEHVVFLLHFNTAAFLVLIPTLWLAKYSEYSGTIISIYFGWFVLHFIAALKTYYQQSWGKTLLKTAIIGFAYFVIATFFITIGAIIGLIFF
jgi:Protein of unknown function (DUF3667)